MDSGESQVLCQDFQPKSNTVGNQRLGRKPCLVTQPIDQGNNCGFITTKAWEKAVPSRDHSLIISQLVTQGSGESHAQLPSRQIIDRCTHITTHTYTRTHTHTWTSRIDLMRVHQNIYRVYQRLTHILATPLKQPLMPDTPFTISLLNECASSGCVQGVPTANPPPSTPVNPTHNVRCIPNSHPFQLINVPHLIQIHT